jgi:peroxiredoxin
VPVFDATTWCSESCFADGHHLLPDGSAEFSRRLGREVIAPLVSRTIAARRQARVERPRR